MGRAAWGVLVGACLACAGAEESHPEAAAGPSEPVLPSVGAVALHLEPESLTLPRAFVGHPVTATLRLSHEGPAPLAVALNLPPPFSLDERQVVVEPGQPRTVTVRLLPTAPGPLDTALTVLSLHPRLQARALPLRATVEPVPACTPSSPCQESRFDAAVGGCVESPRAEAPGSACPPR